MPNLIKAIIADVDGVMVGRSQGVNFPLPHDDVIKALRKVARAGTPIVLCSAKFRAAIDGIIVQASLDNPHITDGGALIINPLGKPKIIEQNIINKATVLEYLLNDNAHTELYTATNCYMKKDDDTEFMNLRSQMLQTKPIFVDSLVDVAKKVDTIKLISVANNPEDVPRIEAQVKRLGPKVHYIRSHHPRIVPRVPCIMTAPGISKEHAARKVMESLGLPFDAVLGIGDSPADWSFMKLCGYAATVGDDQEIRQKVESKGEGHYFHATSVDDHGLLAIFEYFGL